jgi:hypothetical protein
MFLFSLFYLYFYDGKTKYTTMKEKLLGLVLVSLICLPSMADNLSGVILKNGKPKKGITVWLKGADFRVETDKEGRFKFFKVSPDDTLQVTVSMRLDAKFAVGDKKDITVNLGKNSCVLNDGNSEQEITYNHAMLSSSSSDGVTHEMIMRSGMKTVTDILRNFMTGVIVTTDATGNSKVMIRGISSINSSTEPLVVINGAEYNGGDLDNLMPVETIAVIKVNKDGSGWGVRGANGVIEITTISGKDDI